ncbi:TraR/DksA family transcriptional regulator [Desulfovibrio aminophilus]|nr:TraR/DksA family transcriptional regulator [Desulfovibrio aminophilus]MCM0755230.1 TraR/DksA family transcriptional regulator [Desulfovibrio aminophilus]
MTERQKRQIREQLRERVAVLTMRAEQADLTLANCPDDTDLATEITRHSLDLALREREHRELREAEEALRRLDSIDYGLCEDCGGPIGTARLLARPSTRLCVCCQAEQEELALSAA